MTTVRDFIRGRIPGDRDLKPQELLELATAIGRERHLWQHLVRHDPNERYFAELYRDLHLGVWLICWLDAQETGFHDHDLSAGAVYVCDGVIAEDRFVVDEGGLRQAARERRASQAFDFDAAYIHRLRHPGGEPSTSVHCYSPSLWRMGYYEPDRGGALCRTSITYMDELAEGAAH